MYSWFRKLGVFLLITGCSSYKFDESLLKLNETEEIGAVGQITTVTSESQRNFLNDRAATLLNEKLGVDEAIELMIVKSPDFQSLLFDHRSRLAEAAQQGRISNPAFSFERMVKGDATRDEVDMLGDVTKQIEGHTICAFGEGSSWPVQGLLRHFKKEIVKRNNFNPLVNKDNKIPYLVDQHLLENDNAEIKS